MDIVYDRVRVLLRPTPHDHARALQSRSVCCHSRVNPTGRKGICVSVRVCRPREEQMSMLEVPSVNESREPTNEEVRLQREDKVMNICTRTYIH